MSRCFLLLLCLLSFQLAFAAPKPQTVPDKAEPLPPEKLREQVVYVQGRDVWCVDPTTRQKHLLYRDLFCPPEAPLEGGGAPLEFGAEDFAWSPDRTHIAFTYRQPTGGDSCELYVMKWDGTERHAVSHEKYESIINSPRWSPDGQKLLATFKTPWHMGGPMNEYEYFEVFSLDGEKLASSLHDAKGEEVRGVFHCAS